MAENDKGNEGVIEGPGFIIRDRRQFSQDGEKIDRAPEERGQKPQTQYEETPGEPAVEQQETGDKKAPRRQYQDVPLPEVNFTNFVFSLVHSAMLALGSLPDPATGKTEKHLSLAKHVVDTLGMLQQKTQGNLTEEEQRLIDESLFDLRMHYVKEKEKSA
ncbi:MAG: DUF1844 domain-containing protein [Deltaproteobacteria bacterium]|nr:DUF1844 domain-containing protein [Deltaproteobacteria bacterium]MBW2307113.1 DUF1844 domain-containing protein [Deltaproteobacteria bacterium]